MRKRLIALVCVIGLVMMSSVGVLAAEPETDNLVQETTPVVQEQVQETNTVPEIVISEVNLEQEVPTAESEEMSSSDTAEEEITQAEDIQAEEKKNETAGSEQNSAAAVNSLTTAQTAAPETLAATEDSSDRQDKPADVTIAIGGEDIKLEDGGSYVGTTGTITWHKESNTLELKDFTVTVDEYVDINIGIIGDTTLVLIGDNCITSNGSYVVIYKSGGSLNINGGGSLTLDGRHGARISTDMSGGSMNIENVSLALNSKEDSINAGGLELATWKPIDESYNRSINITNSKIQGSYMNIYSQGDIRFNGDSVVDAAGGGRESEEHPSITAEGKIIFALTNGGKVTGHGVGMPGIMSGGGIEFLNGNGIITPSGAIVKSYSQDGRTVWFIVNPDGSYAETVTVGMNGGQTDGNNQNVSTPKVAKNGAGISPKTGDYAQTAVWMLFLLAAAGYAATSVKTRKSNK